jgi:hypothetical protein
MANTKVNPSSFIPSGEMIRELANQAYISEADVKTILRRRGIITPGNQKDRTVSILSCLLLSPPEFELLVDRQTVKEDNLKSAGSGNIIVNETFTNLTTFIHQEYLPGLSEQISPKNAYLRDNYRILGKPVMKTIVKDKEIEVEVTIERNNYNKSWVNHKTQFKAIVSFRHTNNQLTFQRFFTSNETKTVVNKCVSYFEKRCKEKFVVNEKEREHRVRFDDFDNHGRIVFFLKLFNSTEARTLGFEPDNVASFEFSPETSLPLPEELKWMDNKEELIFRGKKVETTFFLNETKYYENLLVWRMQASFKFDISEKGLSGKIKVDFNFHEYQMDKSHKAPLEINLVSALELDQGSLTTTQKEGLKKLLLGRFEELKTTIYDNHFSVPA